MTDTSNIRKLSMEKSQNTIVSNMHDTGLVVYAFNQPKVKLLESNNHKFWFSYMLFL